MSDRAPLLTKDDWHLRHGEGALLLRELDGIAPDGLLALARRFLSAPLTLSLGFYIPGTVVAVRLDAPGVPQISVWNGSSWLAHYFTHNSLGLVGFNPEVEFAHDAVLKFLLSCQDELAAIEARTALANQDAWNRRAMKRADAIAVYRALMIGAST